MAAGAKNPKLLALGVSTWSHLTQVMLTVLIPGHLPLGASEGSGAPPFTLSALIREALSPALANDTFLSCWARASFLGFRTRGTVGDAATTALRVIPSSEIQV